MSVFGTQARRNARKRPNSMTNFRERIEACQGIATRSKRSMIANSTIAITEIVTRTAKTSAVSICPLAEVSR